MKIDSWYYKLVESVFPSPSQYLGIYILQGMSSVVMWTGMVIAVVVVKGITLLPMVKFEGETK